MIIATRVPNAVRTAGIGGRQSGFPPGFPPRRQFSPKSQTGKPPNSSIGAGFEALPHSGQLHQPVAHLRNPGKTIAGSGACDRLVAPSYLISIGRPPLMPSDLDPEPGGSRRSRSGHIRYVRLGTRATVTLWVATRTQAVGSRISGPWRTPQGTSFLAAHTA